MERQDYPSVLLVNLVLGEARDENIIIRMDIFTFGYLYATFGMRPYIYTVQYKV